jgi:hypothetical protein
MSGILLLSADATEVSQNYVSIPQNPMNMRVSASAITITAGCCGVPAPWLPGTRFATLLSNQGHDSDWGLIVEGRGGENTEGLVRRGNTGRVRIEGMVETRSAASGLRLASVLERDAPLLVSPLP